MSNRIELYKKSVDKLFDAYFKDKLKHGSCSACAVGNIVGSSLWGHLFVTMTSNGKQVVAAENKLLISTPSGIFECSTAIPKVKQMLEEALAMIEESGYTKEELMKIEHGFETAEKGDSDEDYMFNGLVVVLDILKEIHEISDDSEEVKRFTNEHNRKLELA